LTNAALTKERPGNAAKVPEFTPICGFLIHNLRQSVDLSWLPGYINSEKLRFLFDLPVRPFGHEKAGLT
jgi:hypothetical protein